MPIDEIDFIPDKPDNSGIDFVPDEKKSFISQDTHTLGDSLKSFFGKTSEAEKAKAANALTYSEMLNISPSTAYRYHDEISTQVKEKLASEKIFTEKKGMGEAVKSGFDTSIAGMMGNQRVPEGFESVDQFERWTNGLITMGLDLPVFLGGMALGGGPETPAGWAGGFGLTAGLRQVLIDRYSKGEAKSFGEFADRTGRAVKETIKGQVVGGLTGVAGAASPIGYKALSELATMTVAGKFIEGEMPTPREFVDNAAMLLAMHAGISGLQNITSVKAQLQKGFVEDGIHPKVILDKIMDNPIQNDLTEEINNTIAEIKQSMPKSLDREALREPPSSVPSADVSKIPGQEQTDLTAATIAKPTSPVDATRTISEKTGDGMPESEITSIKNEAVDLERQKSGTEPLETPVTARPENWKEIVKAKVDSGEIDPRKMADRINNAIEFGEKPPADTLTEEANIAFEYDKARLKNEAKALETEKDNYTGDGRSITEIERDIDRVDDLISANQKATKATGTEQGRALQSRQEGMAEDYSFVAMKQRALEDGIELTPQVKKRLKDLSEKLEKKQQEIDNVSEKALTDNVDKTVEILKNEEALKKRKEKRDVKKEVIDKEFDDIIKKFNKQISGQFNVGIDPVAAKYLIDLARNRIQKGVVSAEGIVDEIYTGLKNAGIEYSKRDIRDAISGYGKTKSMSKDELKVALREAKSQMRLLSALEDARKGESPLRSGLQRDKKSDRVRELTREVTQAMREAGIQKGRTPEEQWKTSLDAVKTRLSNHIVDLARQLETGVKEPKKPGIVYDERANDLKALRDKVQKVLDFVEDTKGKKELSPEQKIKMAMASAEKSLAEYERRIDEGDLAAKKKPSSTPITPELEALRKDRDLLKEVYNMMKDEATPKRTPEQIAEKSFITRTENQIAEFERRLAEKDYEPTPKKEPRTLSDKEQKLQFERDQIKHEYLKQHEQWRLDKRGTGEIIKDSAVEFLGLVKAIKSAYDISAPGRQGFFAFIAHPIKGFKNVGEMFRALKSEEVAFRIETDIKNRPDYLNGTYKKAGLQLYERGGGKATNEQFKSRWAQSVPGIKVSERAFVSFLNLMRVDLFDAMKKSAFSDKAPTSAELKALGSYANEATGHGTIKGYESAIQGLGTVMWAPGLALSRFQMLTLHGLWPGGGRTAATRKAVAKQYARILGGLAIIYSVNAILNDKPVEDDAISSDFGKPIVGNTRIDILAGVSQATVLLERIRSGETKNIKTGRITPIRGDYVPYGGMNVGSVLGNFLRSKLTPVLGIVVNQVVGKDMVGKKVTLYDIPEEAIVPLSMLDIYQAMQEEGVPAGLALGVLGMFGIGIQTHEQKGAKR